MIDRMIHLLNSIGILRTWVEVAKKKPPKHVSQSDLYSDLVTLVNTCKNGNSTGLLEKLQALVTQYSTQARDPPSGRHVLSRQKVHHRK